MELLNERRPGGMSIRSQGRCARRVVWLAALALLATGMGESQAQADESRPASKSDESLEQKMQALNLNDRAPALVSEERLYAVQNRLSPLSHRSELSLGVGSNLTSDSFINSNQFELNYRYHLDDRWSVGIERTWVSNSLSAAANDLQSSVGMVPRVPYAIARTDLTGEANLFFGKLRITSERVFYFDQYVAAGVGFVQMNDGTVGALVGDVGVVGWIGRSASARLGLRDYYNNENYGSGQVRATICTRTSISERCFNGQREMSSADRLLLFGTELGCDGGASGGFARSSKRPADRRTAARPRSQAIPR